MSIPYQLSLLRRTFAVLVAATTFGAMSDAHAQGKVKLTGASGQDECSYSSMSITPDGSVTVQCSGTTPPPPPPPPSAETFAMSTSALTSPALSLPQISVVRTGPASSTFAATTVFITYSGNGCVLNGNTYPIPFAAGQSAFPFEAPLAYAETCTVTLAAPPAPAILGTPAATTITLGSGTPPPPPPTSLPSSCPTGFVVPENMISSNIAGLGNPIFALQKSGQVISIPLLNLNGLNTGQLTFGESPTAVTPQPVTIEISINKCPGMIDSSPGSCNMRSTNSSYNSITWFAKAYRGVITDSTSASLRGYCWAGDGDQYYVNARWTYQVCPLGQQVCGFAIQYNQGPY